MAGIRRQSAAAALVVLFALTGCAPQPEQQPSPTTQAPTPTATPSASAPASPTATPPDEHIGGVDTSTWVDVEAEGASFRLPPDWSTRAVDGGTGILRPDGEQQLFLGAPQPEQPCPAGSEGLPGTVLESVPASEVGEALAVGVVMLDRGDGSYTFGMGLAGEVALSEATCPFMFQIPTAVGQRTFASETWVTGAGDASPWIVDSLEQGREYTASDEYRTIRAILLSARFE